jgi:hypothetical protein
MQPLGGQGVENARNYTFIAAHKGWWRRITGKIGDGYGRRVQKRQFRVMQH